MTPAPTSAASTLVDSSWCRPRRLPAVFRFWAVLVPQVIVAPVLTFGITFLHELAHAAAALSIGGELTEFSWLPTKTNLGHIRWVPPPNAGDLDFVLVSVAPYLMWTLLAGVVLLVAWLPNRFHWSAASSLFVWGYAVPIGDIAGNLMAPRGDLSAPGVEGLIVTCAGAGAVLIAWGLGWLVQRRLFPDAKVGALGYLATTLVMGGAWAAAAALGLILVTT